MSREKVHLPLFLASFTILVTLDIKGVHFILLGLKENKIIDLLIAYNNGIRLVIILSFRIFKNLLIVRLKLLKVIKMPHLYCGVSSRVDFLTKYL